jgi:hypothetical protein
MSRVFFGIRQAVKHKIFAEKSKKKQKEAPNSRGASFCF